jgi:hypothetical protein
MMSSYHDPTFDQAGRALVPVTQAAIIEWLKRGGIFTMPPVEPKKRRRQGISASLRPQRAPPASVVDPAG